MSQPHTLRSQSANGNGDGVGGNEEPRPLAIAISAVLLGNPAQPVELAPEIFVRAETIVKALAPEILQRVEALLTEPESLSVEAVERISQYTNGRAA